MPIVTCHMSISLDGYVAGPRQSLENGLGEGGVAMHHWHLGEVSDPVDADFAGRIVADKGAFVMGRNMYGPVRGSWDDHDDWRGWWGEDPPYHAPVFVLTHHAHDPIQMEGGTTFHFVTEGFDSALAQAKQAAGERDVDIAGGASTVQQALRAGAIDELTLDVVPVLLGEGERLFDGVAGVQLEQVEVAPGAHVTHLRYRLAP